MSDLELMPCPFCGSAAEMNYHRPTESYYVACSGCTAHTCDYGAEPEQATETWNKRTQPEATAPAQDLSAAILAMPEAAPAEIAKKGIFAYYWESGFREARANAAALASSANALSAGDSETAKDAARKALESYAESYDQMARLNPDKAVGYSAVAHDIRRNMVESVLRAISADGNCDGID